MTPRTFRLAALSVTVAAIALLAFALGGEAKSPSPSEAEEAAFTTPGTLFAIQSVSASGAVLAISGEAVQQGPLEVRWFDATEPAPATPTGALRAMAPAGGRGEQAPLGTTLASVIAPERTAEARLAPLGADTRYRYVVQSRTGVRLAEAVFRTAPLPGARAISFAAIGDTGEPAAEVLGGGASTKGAIVRALLASRPRPEVVVHMGDVVYPDGSWAFYKRSFFGPMQPLMAVVPVFPALGNHDMRAEGARAYLDVFALPANNPERSERYYSFDWGDVHFVSIDVVGSPYVKGAPQRAWLEADLAASKAAWKVVYFHYPPFSDASHGDNAQVTEELVPLFERAKVDLCLTGHDHCYERLAPKNGVLYVVTGGGGAGLYAITPTKRLVQGRSIHHLVRGRADARRMTLEAVDAEGAVFDTVTLEK